MLVHESANGCSSDPFLYLHAYGFCLLYVNAILLINRLPFIITTIQSHIKDSDFTCKSEPGKIQSDNPPPGQDLKLLLLVKSVRGANVSFPVSIFRFTSSFGTVPFTCLGF